jgi:branched-subunit amino acid transport protein
MQLDQFHKERAHNCDFTHGYRLCILASGSLITNIFSCFTLIIVSCLHLGQNSGKFSSTVSTPILTRVLLPQIGHNIHSYLHTLPSPYLMLLLTAMILMPATLSCFSMYSTFAEAQVFHFNCFYHPRYPPFILFYP